MKRFFQRIMPHAVIVLSLMTLTFFSIDRVNPIMAFMTSELSKWVFALLALTGLLTAVFLIGMQWKDDDRRARRASRRPPDNDQALDQAAKALEQATQALERARESDE
jgi:hypothetical protein